MPLVHVQQTVETGGDIQMPAVEMTGLSGPFIEVDPGSRREGKLLSTPNHSFTTPKKGDSPRQPKMIIAPEPVDDQAGVSLPTTTRQATGCLFRQIDQEFLGWPQASASGQLSSSAAVLSSDCSGSHGQSQTPLEVTDAESSLSQGHQQPGQQVAADFFQGFEQWLRELTQSETAEVNSRLKALTPQIFELSQQWWHTLPRREAMRRLLYVLDRPELVDIRAAPREFSEMHPSQLPSLRSPRMQIPRSQLLASSAQRVPPPRKYSVTRNHIQHLLNVAGQRSSSSNGNFGEVRDKHTGRMICQGPGIFGISTVWDSWGRVVATVGNEARMALLNDDVIEVAEIHIPEDLVGALRHDAPPGLWKRFKKLGHIENSEPNRDLPFEIDKDRYAC